MCRCVDSGGNVPFRCYEDVEYEKDLSAVVQPFDEQPLFELGLSFVILSRVFSHLSFYERFNRWTHDCDVELRMRRHAWSIFAEWLNGEFLSIHLVHPPSNYIETLGRWQE